MSKRRGHRGADENRGHLKAEICHMKAIHTNNSSSGRLLQKWSIRGPLQIGKYIKSVGVVYTDLELAPCTKSGIAGHGRKLIASRPGLILELKGVYLSTISVTPLKICMMHSATFTFAHPNPHPLISGLDSRPPAQ